MLEVKSLFDGLDFEEIEMEYKYGNEFCYRGPDSAFYRVSHFGQFYVIEYAANEEAAKLNQFEDTDLYDDSLPAEQLAATIREDLRKYVTE